MTEKQEVLRLIQSHKAIEPFDYKIVVDWAIELIREGKETDNILMLASFSEPIEKWEISPYISAVLNDFGLKELECDDAIIAQTHFLLLKILKDIELRKNLRVLSQVCINNDYDQRIMNFYLLCHAWDELEEIGVNFYIDGADLENIEDIIKSESRKWIDKYVNRNEDTSHEKEVKEKKTPLLTTPTNKHEDNNKRNVNKFSKLWAWLVRK